MTNRRRSVGRMTLLARVARIGLAASALAIGLLASAVSPASGATARQAAAGARAGQTAQAAAAGQAARAVPEAAKVTGWVRLAHLSPNTPAVDVYLYNYRDPTARLILHHVAYGTVSPYLSVPAGEYTVAMRAANAKPTAPAVLSTNVVVHPGHAYTVAGMGPFAGIRLEVIPDQLTAPTGRAVIRVIQASMRQRLLTIDANHTALADSLSFGQISAYRSVAPGWIKLRVTGSSESATQRVYFPAGSIHTVAVLDNGTQLKLVPLDDIAGSGTVPAGSPGTGLGGTAPRPGPSRLPWMAVTIFGLLLTAAAIMRLRRPAVASSGAIRSGAVRSRAIRSGGIRPAATTPGAAWPGDARSRPLPAPDVWPGDARSRPLSAPDVWPGEARRGDTRPGDAWTGPAAHPGDAWTESAQPGDAWTGPAAHPGDIWPGDVRSRPTQPGDSRPAAYWPRTR